MPTIVQSAHDRLVREVADSYVRRGYLVEIEPSKEDLPEFLDGFRPDLLARKPDDNIIVEIKSRGKVRQADYWKRLGNTLKDHNGWRFQLVLDNQREEELLGATGALIASTEIQQRLDTATDLVNQGLLDSALLVSWSAAEALLWQLSRKAGLAVPNQGPAALLAALTEAGQLSRSDYNSLSQVLQVRNLVAQGFRSEDLTAGIITQVQKVAQRLMNKVFGASKKD